MFDLGCRVRKAINGWFKTFVESAINPVFGMLGSSLLATPRLDQMDRVQDLWSGALVVANTCFVLLVVVGGLTLMGNPTMQTSYTVKDIAPRLVVGMVFANLSLLLVGKAIAFANGLSHGLLAPGVNPGKAAETLSEVVTHAIVAPAEVGIFIILVAIGAIVLGLILGLIFIVRIMLTTLLIAAAPLALICHALPQTEGVARLWWRAFAGVLAIQVAQALVFVAAARVFLTRGVHPIFGVHTIPGQFDLWITICLLYVLVRIPAWISRMVWRGGLNRSPVARVARTVAAIVVFRGLLGKLGRGGRTAGAAASRGQQPHRASQGPRGGPSPRPLPAGSASATPTPAAPTRSGPQPRWAHRSRQWTPPDPEWHAKTAAGRGPDSLEHQQRWNDPARRLTPPDTSPRRGGQPNQAAPTSSPSPRPQPRTSARPDPNRPWTPPGSVPTSVRRPAQQAPSRTPPSRSSPRRPARPNQDRRNPDRPWTRPG